MKKIVNMNDGWLFSKEEVQIRTLRLFKPGESAGNILKNGANINLPHTWNIPGVKGDGDDYYRGACWYEKEFVLREVEEGCRIFLEVGAAGNTAEVYVNGKLAGDNRCGYALFRFDISNNLNVGSNRIMIKVDNSQFNDVYPMMADFTFYGGLYRDVNLIYAGDVHFDYLDGSRDGIYLKQEKVGDTDFKLEVVSNLVNDSITERQVTQKLTLVDEAGETVATAISTKSMMGRKRIEIEMAIDNPHLWDGIADPYLYRLSAELFDGGKLVDQQEIPIGFRTVEAHHEKGLILNGKPIKLRGVSRHQDRQGVGNAISRQDMEEDMAIIREVGANSIRLAHYQHDDYFYSLCDKYGLLVWAEIPFISVPSQTDDENLNAKEHMDKLIRQGFNHTSIYCWGVQNEITIAAENERTHKMVQEMVVLTESMDNGRLTAQAQIHSVANDSPLNRLTDIVGYNLYYGWYYGEMDGLGKRLDAFHNCQKDKPVLVSEYGVDTNPAYHSYEPAVKDYSEEYQLKYHHKVIKTIESRDFILGGYVWNMFDFGSNDRDEGGVKGQNQKGLVTFDRKQKKDAYYLYKAYWSEESFVHIAGRRFVNRHEEANDICILTNESIFDVYHNGDFLARVENTKPLNVIPGVKLKSGHNDIRVVTGGCEDSITLNRVDQPDPSYIYKKDTESSKAVNWFERFDLSHGQTIDLKEGYYSTHDTVGQLMENEMAKEVFNKYFEGFAQHPKFKTMLMAMSIEKMATISQLNIPKELLGVINGELNSIRK